LFSLKNGKVDPGSVRNVTQRKGYDNQPRFFPDSKQFFYTSIGDDGQADIFAFDIESSKLTKITATPESEYSPTLTPDGKFISTVRVEKDGTQRLWKFPVNGGAPVLILSEIKPVGYHAWLDSQLVALFILGEPPTLQIADVDTGKSSVIASNIGRSLHKIPGKACISFVQKLSETIGTIEEYDPATKQTRPIIQLFPETEDYTWDSSGTIWTSKGSSLYKFRPEKGKDWTLESDLSTAGIKQITRIAISPDEKWLALVSTE